MGSLALFIMAISINKYVNITSQFPETDPVGRAFGGLVFSWSASKVSESTTTDEVNEWSGFDFSAAELKTLKSISAAYEAGDIVAVTEKQVAGLFGGRVGDDSDSSGTIDEDEITTSDEYAFALKYYNYLSPSNRFASKLKIAKVTGTPVEAFKKACDKTNMFGSFTFLGDGTATCLDGERLNQMVDVAVQNQKFDTRFLFVVADVLSEDHNVADVVESKEKFDDYKGVTFVCGTDFTDAAMPMAILAATDFDNGSVTNYMFKSFSWVEPCVRSDEDYKDFVNKNINFYGQAQNNGQTFDFYQRGFNTDGTDTSVYCNEMWLKAACTTALFEMLRTTERVPADAVGAAMVQQCVMDACVKAVANGMFLTKSLTAKQQMAILQIVEDEKIGNANSILEDIITDIAINGYAVLAFITDQPKVIEDVLAPSGEYYARYILFYGTGDSVRYVEGTHTLLR